MTHPIFDFLWLDWDKIERTSQDLNDATKYEQIAAWAGKARGRNPLVFDALIEWLRDDAQWTTDKLSENRQVLMEGVIQRFKTQNERLRVYLRSLEPADMVNPAVFPALDSFDAELAGKPHHQPLREVVSQVFADFSCMLDPVIRHQIAGSPSGASGTDNIDVFGYLNGLKIFDAQVQWTLFMPAVIVKQQKEFKVDHFEYLKLPAMRFIGQEGEEFEQPEARRSLFSTLDALATHKSGFDYDIFFMHHYGLTVDVGPWHGFWGRFFQAETPVPDGFTAFDFLAEGDQEPGLPYVMQFAYATFSGDPEAMHTHEGFDVDGMYDVTRNIILSQNVMIPYPEKYWMAEVFLEGWEKPSTAYMFGVILQPLETS